MYQKILFVRVDIVFTNLHRFTEPTDAGVVPPEYRTSFPSANNPHHVLQQQQQQQQQHPPQQQQMQHQQQQLAQNGSSPPRPTEKKPHQFTNTPVEEWAKEQVGIMSLLAFVSHFHYFHYFVCMALAFY